MPHTEGTARTTEAILTLRRGGRCAVVFHEQTLLRTAEVMLTDAGNPAAVPLNTSRRTATVTSLKPVNAQPWPQRLFKGRPLRVLCGERACQRLQLSKPVSNPAAAVEKTAAIKSKRKLLQLHILSSSSVLQRTCQIAMKKQKSTAGFTNLQVQKY